MMDVQQQTFTALQRLVAAYKLRLAKAAERLGAQPETWGLNETISRQREERLLAGEGEYRLSPYPYPGLRSFDSQEGDIFFGREHNVTDVQNRLAAEQVVVVHGGSGSGKSSLLRAGLLPYLNTTRRIPGREGSWYKAEFRPRKDPLGELIDALVDQWLLPLIDLKVPAISKAMGMPPDEPRSAVRARLHCEMRARFFDNERPKSREVVLAALLDISGRQLDEYDRLASRGLRVPGPSMLLLLDQFEEVFRPEVPPHAREALLNLIVDLHGHQERTREKGGLFLAITMRSEELHLCAEHQGLSGVINHSSYLLELLDPDEPSDREDLHHAIVQPARNVFDDWGLEYDRGCADAPFAPGMPDWLLAGAKLSSKELEHRPDQLPLLQHALQATWHQAMRRWSTSDLKDSRVTIERQDLPGQVSAETELPDLGSCLRLRADKAAERAANRFTAVGHTSAGAGEAALRAAFRSLARRTDGSTWARRFAEPHEMRSFMAAEHASATARMTEEVRWEALRQALHIFLLRGYLSGGGGRPYDISHEALIRNWPKFREWLQGPEEVTYALIRVLTEVNPGKFRSADDPKKIQLIPADVASRVAMIGRNGLPEKWAEDQIAPTLEHPRVRQRWGDEPQKVLREMIGLSAEADSARRRAEQAEIARQRQEEKDALLAKQRERELAQAKELAFRTRLGFIVATVLAIAAASQAIYATQQKGIAETKSQIASLKGEFSSLNSGALQIRKAQDQANAGLSFFFELERDRQRASAAVSQDQVRAAEANLQQNRTLVRSLDATQQETIWNINKESERLWNQKSKSEQQNIVAAVERGLKGLNPQSKLRVAIYAVAAIPREYPDLNEALRNAIIDYRLRSYVRPPSASQIWGLAFDPTNAHRAAVGDDNGVVWVSDPLPGSSGPTDESVALTAVGSLVNALAFSADGTLLAAAHRSAGVVVWDISSGQHTLRCQLRPAGANSGAYDVAFRGATLAVAGADKAVHIWDTSQPGCPSIAGKVFQRPDFDLVFGVAFSPDGRLLAAASGDGTVAVWNVDLPEQPVLESRMEKPMFAVAFSPDGRLLAATGADGNGYLWDIKTQERTVLPSQGGTVGHVSFSPNGKMVVATAGADGAAIVTDVDTRKERLALGGRGQIGPAATSTTTAPATNDLFGVAFSTDSNYLLTGSNLSPVASLWAIGDNPVKANNRNELIELGVQRLAERTLRPEECQVLREMQIPIFEFAQLGRSDNDKDMVCLLPLLVGGTRTAR
jgi:WD40 repeat protein